MDLFAEFKKLEIEAKDLNNPELLAKVNEFGSKLSQMLSFESFIKSVKQLMWKQNVDELIKVCQTPDKIPQSWKLKLNNHLQIVQLIDPDQTLETVCKSIISDPNLQIRMCKDPCRQGIHEKLQFEYIKKFIEPDIKKLPKYGKNALYLNSKGELTNTRGKETIKSIDFKVGEYYAQAKYTHLCGGSQDNAFHELINYLVFARRHNSKVDANKKKFMVIIGGSYYLKRAQELVKYETPYIKVMHLL